MHPAARLVGYLLFVGLAVDRARLLLAGGCVVDDSHGRVLVSMRGMLDQFFLAQLETLRLAAAGLFDRLALFAPTLASHISRTLANFTGSLVIALQACGLVTPWTRA